MAISHIGFNRFRLRQYTGIPLSRISEAASEIAYDILRADQELRREIMDKYSIRSPGRGLYGRILNMYEVARPLSINLKGGYHRE